MPLGVFGVLFACWGVNSLIGLSSVSFPASVALLLILFLLLILSERFLGNKRTSSIVRIVEIPVSSILICLCSHRLMKKRVTLPSAI